MSTLNVATAKITTLQSTGGTNSSTPEEIVLGRAKAWIKMNGTGTIAEYDSFNVSSLQDNGTGSYQAFFATNMADGNYVAMANAGRFAHCGGAISNYATDSFRINVANLQGNAENRSVVHAIVFGRQ
tara:strand:- start:489 stop:869 length:381 start_codon:yes stop_codon:yes gene_type:complete